ncbi:MAG: dihydrolipoyl dehydrogenase [Bacteroidota bacterium]|jgi:dihydrolipoamide dehydrogenase|nr:dihydrolipoyl dehydrogenase [Bacteroidota bacterium]
MAQAFDVVVIGGGPGGYVAAIRAAQLGFRTACIEAKHLGGICLNWGCIPTKSLLRNAEIWETVQHAEDYGLTFDNVSFDFSKIIARSRGIADRMSKGVAYLFKKYNVTHIEAYGKLLAAGRVGTFNRDGAALDEIEATHVILATGARPRSIPGIEIDHERVISYFEAMSLPERPERLIVLGAGAIGVEFAYFYNALGTQVTIVEMLDHLLPIEDEDVSKELERAFRKKKIGIKTKSKVKSIARGDDGVRVTVESEKGEEVLDGDMALMAVGVQGNVENIGLETVGVALDRGYIVVDEYYRTNIPGVYAIGDVVGPPWLAHVASAEGITCVEAIAGKHPVPVNYDNIPGCTYCQPQVASVGLTEKKAREQGYELKIGKFPFSASGKAVAAGHPEGFVKMIYDAKYGELLGAHIIGAEATELIAEAALGRTLETTEHELIKTVHAHPTLSEALMEATAVAYGESVNF